MKYIVFFICMFFYIAVTAEEGASISSTRHHSPHIHGVANLTLALEGHALEIQFVSPAVNALGFEHEATTPEEQLEVKRVEQLLKAPEKIFSFERLVKCTTQSSVINTENTKINEHTAKHFEQDYSEAHQTTHNKPPHNEISANYQFNCENTAQLKNITVNLFKYFPRIEKINAVWVTATHQGSATLNAVKNSISVK